MPKAKKSKSRFVPPLYFFGTRSLRPLDDLLAAVDRTIALMWSDAGGGQYRVPGGWNITAPIMASITASRAYDRLTNRSQVRMEVHAVIIAHWQEATDRRLRLGALWLSDDVPKLRELRIKDFILNNPDLSATWTQERLPTMDLVLRLGLDLAIGVAAFRAYDNTASVVLTARGWKGIYDHGPNGVRLFLPQAARTADLLVLPKVRRILGLNPAAETQPWTAGALVGADRESIYRDADFVRNYLRT